MTTVKKVPLVLILVGTVGLALLNPLGFNLQQTLLVASLMITVACWATEAVHKSWACGLLLLAFIIFGKSHPLNLAAFLWGDMNLLIISTTLLSLGFMKTGLIQHHVDKLFRRVGSNRLGLLALPYLISLVLTILIPQAFVRVIILGTILDGLVEARTEQEKRTKAVLIFNAFVSATIVYMLFSNGDVVLNLSVLSMAGEAVAEQLNFLSWLKLMGLPTLVTAGLVLFLINLIFNKELSQFNPNMLRLSNPKEANRSSKNQLISLIVMIGVLVAWASANLHGLQPWWFAFLGVAIFFATKILDKTDLNTLNPHFFLFLMTIFSIGRVLDQTGVTGIVFEHLQALIPASHSPLYLLSILAVIMLLHMAIGSVVATISVVLPILLPLMEAAGYPAPLIVLMIYLATNLHFLLPFQHATLLIGSGKKYYPDSIMLRYGAVMTLVTPLLILLVYLTWWRFLT